MSALEKGIIHDIGPHAADHTVQVTAKGLGLPVDIDGSPVTDAIIPPENTQTHEETAIVIITRSVIHTGHRLLPYVRMIPEE